MAKKNGNWKIYLGLVLALTIAILGFAVNYGAQAESAANTKESVVELKKEGCDPADEAGDEILVIKTEMKYIKGGIDDIKTEQKAMQKTAIERQEAVLKAIHAIKER